MNYQDTLDYLYENLPMYQRVGDTALKKDLTNISRLCEELGNPQHKFMSVHIAGTNGKGSTAHMLAAVLQAAGYKTGLYTSPHLKEFTERIRINGKEVSKDYVTEFVNDNRDRFDEINPSFFEMTVAMAFSYFAKEKVDIAIIEVGLGGRLDSTNIITPLISIITSIGLDHQKFLGDTLPLIAQEKAGIMKRNMPVVVSRSQSSVIPVLINHARITGAPVYFADIYYKFEEIPGEDGKMHVRNCVNNTSFEMDLPGSYQVKNLPGVFKAIELLRGMGYPINYQQVTHALANTIELTGIKGRWQVLSNEPMTICDTGHNTMALKEIIKQLKDYNYRQLHMVIGMVSDKDVEPMLELMPKDALYYFCEPNIPRALDADSLYERATGLGLNGKIVRDVNEAIGSAQKNAQSDDLIFIGGSTFVVAEINDL